MIGQSNRSMKIGNSEKQISGLQWFQETEFEDCKGSKHYLHGLAWLGLDYVKVGVIAVTD